MIDLDTLVDDVMREFPETIRVFLDYGMHCVGCPIGGFHSVEDSCRAHGIDATAFLAALRRADLRNDTEVPTPRMLSFRRV